jgi:hypothetical protein
VRYDDEASALIIDDDFALPAKFFIKEDPPAFVMSDGRSFEHKTRVFRCTFENRWSLSIIWGSVTYSTNHDHPWGHALSRDRPPEFVEEPERVEVGIIMPEEAVRPAVSILPIIEGIHGSEWVGPTEIPEHTYELWGDPIGYVTAEQLRFLVGYVSRLDSHTWPQLESGPYLDTDDEGRMTITYEVRAEAENGP